MQHTHTNIGYFIITPYKLNDRLKYAIDFITYWCIVDLTLQIQCVGELIHVWLVTIQQMPTLLYINTVWTSNSEVDMIWATILIQAWRWEAWERTVIRTLQLGEKIYDKKIENAKHYNMTRINIKSIG